MKLKPEASFTLNQTNWRPGVDTFEYQTTYQQQTEAVKTAQQKVPFPRIDKNASDQVAIFGEASVPPGELFQTENRSNFCPTYSVMNSETYTRVKPAEGYTRETANQTNYDLGMPGESGEYKSTTHAHMLDPKLQKEQPLQPNIGGWLTGPVDSNTGSKTYFKDIETHINVERGGGGGTGLGG